MPRNVLLRHLAKIRSWYGDRLSDEVHRPRTFEIRQAVQSLNPGRRPGGNDGELMVHFIECIEQRQPIHVPSAPDERARAIQMIQAIVDNEHLVRRAVSGPVLHLDGEGRRQSVRPTPAHVVAGYFGCVPADPRYPDTALAPPHVRYLTSAGVPAEPVTPEGPAPHDWRDPTY